ELRTVRDYLEIERVRFGDRLRYSIELPAAMEPHLVPRLALQTLVENSVKYAVTPRRDGGSVRLIAETNDSVVRLIVEDDGPGFALTDAPTNHGIALLRERIELLYGARASLDVRRASGRTEVVLTVPR